MTRFSNLVNKLLEQFGGHHCKCFLYRVTSLSRFTLICINMGRVCKGDGPVQGHASAPVLASRCPDVQC